jgi:hypothetical protein
MGSLILLLLIIDRRARVVARTKALRAAAAYAPEDSRTAAARQAEWERRRQLLHESLEREDEAVLSEVRALQGNLTSAARGITTEAGLARELRERLQAERSQLARWEEELNGRRSAIQHADQETTASQTELVRLTAELEHMERTLAELKAARQRQQQMHSLVPYRGKHGDSRKPLYIECAAGGVTFHPDHTTLAGLQLTPAAIRAELDRRLAQLSNPVAKAYVLLLVRPGGITPYYRTVSAFQGLAVDYGYEFVDADWILDFPEEDTAATPQPWMAAAPSPAPRSSARAPGPKVAGLPSSGVATIVNRARGVTFNGNASGGGSTELSPGLPGERGPGFGTGTAVGSGVSVGAPGRVGIMAPTGREGSPAGPGSLSLGGYPRTGNLSFAATPAGTSSTAEPGVSGGSVGRALSGDSAAPLLAQGPPATTAGEPVVPRGSLSRGTTGDFAGPLLAQGPPVTAELARPVPMVSTEHGSEAAGTNAKSAGEAPASPGGPGISTPPPLLPTINHGSNSPGPPSGGEPSTTAATSPGAPRNDESGASESGRPAPGFATDPLAAMAPRRKPAPMATLRPSLFTRNRDWIIPIECTADALVIPSLGQRIPVAALMQSAADVNPLLEAVKKMIARRQATVQPEEPPYRPMIHFRVHPDGVRTYYLAYPALEALHVPMARENVQPEEEAKSRGLLDR